VASKSQKIHSFEGIPGAIGNVLGGLLSEEDLQGEELGELHELHELGELHERGEVESGEQFFRRIARRIGGFVKRAAAILKRVAGSLPPWSCLQLAGRWAASWGNWPLRR
jgi:hypothetical protein